MERAPAKSFEELIVWQKAHQLVLDVYRLTRLFPTEERFSLTSQLRRSAISVAANIAEGFKKKGKPDKIRFMNTAQGSLEETRYYLILANDLAYADVQSCKNIAEEVGKLLNAYSKGILNHAY